MDSVDAQAAWNAVLKHDRRYDGRFVYAVSSTYIYCRPSCPSRRPARHRVSFFHRRNMQRPQASVPACVAGLNLLRAPCRIGESSRPVNTWTTMRTRPLHFAD